MIRKNSGAHPRISVTLPPKVYENIRQLAEQRKVSIARIVREGMEKYAAVKKEAP